MAAGWTTEETGALVSIWGQANVQNKLDGIARNRTIFEKIAKEMAELGFERTWQQCRTKVKNLTQKFRKVNTCSELLDNYLHYHCATFKVKDSNRVSGKQRTTCPYFEELDAILGTRAASSPAILLESSITEETSGKLVYK